MPGEYARYDIAYAAGPVLVLHDAAAPDGHRVWCATVLAGRPLEWKPARITPGPGLGELAGPAAGPLAPVPDPLLGDPVLADRLRTCAQRITNRAGLLAAAARTLSAHLAATLDDIEVRTTGDAVLACSDRLRARTPSAPPPGRGARAPAIGGHRNHIWI